ncbi:MAG: hypothetical protein JWO44_1153 [Bacteroidetes bacterium]|nr:hypothetical protein [Bacteroidota bacterium]
MKKLLLLTTLLMLTGTFAKAGCPTLTLTFTTTDASCPNNNDGSATVNVTGGSGTYTYLWSVSAGAQTTATATGLMPGNYSVTIMDGSGPSCITTGNVTVAAPPVPTPTICMVTVDAHSVNNFVYWDQTPYTNVDSFIIYRETSPLVYSRIGAVSSDSLSEFEDTTRSAGPANGDPNLAAYRYRIQVLDTCGNYGPMSLYHSTIYIVDDGLGEFSWASPYMIEGMPNPVTNYVLLCDTANVDVWGPVQTVPGTDTLANDPGFVSHSSVANWRVKTAWSISCTPTRATVNTTRSNIKHAGLVTTGIAALHDGSSMVMYPNPANSEVIIGLSPEIKKAKLCIVNIVGQLMFEETLEANGTSITSRIDVSGYAKGVYLVSVESAGLKTFKKLIVN